MSSTHKKEENPPSPHGARRRPQNEFLQILEPFRGRVPFLGRHLGLVLDRLQALRELLRVHECQLAAQRRDLIVQLADDGLVVEDLVDAGGGGDALGRLGEMQRGPGGRRGGEIQWWWAVGLIPFILFTKEGNCGAD